MRAVAILGNDAVLAARPSTAVQLAHACLRAGFETTIPASWGDELVAAESVRQLKQRGDGGAILCACSHVEAALLAPGDDLAPLLVPVVAPPVAAARYVRRVLGDVPLHVTFVGRCPAASADPAIDVQLSPAAFLRQLSERGIVLAEQPTVFDSVLPPDRRRHFSLPGGAPAPSSLWEGERTRTLIEIESEEYKSELAQHLIAHRRALIDLAPRLGCACSGAVGTTLQASARAGVMSGEPPRAAHPVVEAPEGLQLSRRILPRAPAPAPAVAVPPSATVPTVARGIGSGPSYQPREALHGAPRETPRSESQRAVEPVRHADASRSTSRRNTPSGPFRVYTGHVPTARSAEGRPVPRAYAAHRKTPPSSRTVGPEAAPPAPSPAADAPRSPEPKAEKSEPRTEQKPTEPAPRETREAREAPEVPNAPPAPPAPAMQATQAMHLDASVAYRAPAAAPTPAVAPTPTDSERPIEIVRETVVERSETVETVESVTLEPAHAEPEVAAEDAAHEELDDDRFEAAAEEITAEEITAEEELEEAPDDEAPVRRASATLITHATSRQTSSSIVALERSRAIDSYRQPTAFRLPYPRDPRSITVAGLTVALVAVLAVTAIRAVRTRDDGGPATPIGAAPADAATLPPAGAARAVRPPAPPETPSAVAPPAPPRTDRGGRASSPTTPERGAATTPRARRASSAAATTTLPPAVPAESVARPAASVPRPAPVESTAPARVPASAAPVAPAPAAPQALTAAERDSIQREIAARRARADSIQRRIDSMRTP